MSSDDYNERAVKLGLSSKQEVKSISVQTNVVFLDVRSESEVAESAFAFQGREVLNVPCSRDDASLLQSKASEILKDKEAPLILFCRSGARASKAKEALMELGYSNVLNAGGLSDLNYL
mmetsp:Transcript_6105/g.7750  ORF Transcript_6105/g.7750 Transcript_6105/m.7750 type:complete len:119 (+) Transcript_6105:712-1068(+)